MRCTSDRAARLQETARGRATRRRRTLLAATLAALPLAGCDRTVQPTEIYPPIAATNVDADAGSWRMIVLAGPDQIAVPEPAPTTSAAYLAELGAVKSAQANATPAQ